MPNLACPDCGRIDCDGCSWEMGSPEPRELKNEDGGEKSSENDLMMNEIRQALKELMEEIGDI